jgi:hypothetical protein
MNRQDSGLGRSLPSGRALGGPGGLATRPAGYGLAAPDAEAALDLAKESNYPGVRASIGDVSSPPR